MSRAWGYIFVFVAIAVGAGSLLLPLPESVTLPTPAPEKSTQTAARKAPSPRGKALAKAVVPPKAAKSSKLGPTVAKTFPMDDTTRSRQLVKPQPQPKG